MLLFLLSIGLTVILAFCINLAHGALYMLGAYLERVADHRFRAWRRTFARTTVVAVMLIGLAACFRRVFARELVIEIAVLAILAINLDMVAGYGGMVSCAMGRSWGWPPMASSPSNSAGRRRQRRPSAAARWRLVGWITARTSGIFIMATLALGKWFTP